VPELPAVIVIQLTLLVAVHVQPLPDVTVTAAVAVPPLPSIDVVVGATENAHGAL
jgi:hypothetical protein